MSLSKTEVIHCEIDTRKNDRHNLVTRFVFPIFQRNIYEIIRNTLKANLAIVYNRHAINTHVGVCFIFGTGELPYPANEFLTLKVINIRHGEGIAISTNGACSTYFLIHDKIIALHKAVFSREYWQHITIELKT